MAVGDEELDMMRDLFAGLGPIHAKRMFGGAGLYCDGLIFAIVADGLAWIKGDDTNRAAFEEVGSERFTYDARGKPMQMNYWRLPDAALDDPDEATRWARLGLEAARRAAAKKKPKKT